VKNDAERVPPAILRDTEVAKQPDGSGRLRIITIDDDQSFALSVDAAIDLLIDLKQFLGHQK
jgi:hypothetical protein